MFSKKKESAPNSIASVEDYPTLRIVRLRGAIDQTAVAEIDCFRKWVEKHRGFKHKHVLLDFKHVTNIDTSAVAEILQHVSDLKSAHFRLGAVHLDKKLKNMLEVLKVEKLIFLYENESEALKDFKSH